MTAPLPTLTPARRYQATRALVPASGARKGRQAAASLSTTHQLQGRAARRSVQLRPRLQCMGTGTDTHQKKGALQSSTRTAVVGALVSSLLASSVATSRLSGQSTKNAGVQARSIAMGAPLRMSAT